MEREGEKQGDRLRGCVFALEWDIGHRVCVLVASFVCVWKKNEMRDITETWEREKWEKEELREKGRRGEVGSWHRWGWLSLNRTSFHTHYTCPLQSSHRTGTGATLWKAGLHFWLMKLPVFHGGAAQPGKKKKKTINVIQSLSATELFQGFNIRAYPHNRARVGIWSKGVISLGRKDQNFWTATRKNFPPFCLGI